MKKRIRILCGILVLLGLCGCTVKKGEPNLPSPEPTAPPIETPTPTDSSYLVDEPDGNFDTVEVVRSESVYWAWEANEHFNFFERVDLRGYTGEEARLWIHYDGVAQDEQSGTKIPLNYGIEEIPHQENDMPTWDEIEFDVIYPLL